jgi:hypothetical protein
LVRSIRRQTPEGGGALTGIRDDWPEMMSRSMASESGIDKRGSEASAG